MNKIQNVQTFRHVLAHSDNSIPTSEQINSLLRDLTQGSGLGPFTSSLLKRLYDMASFYQGIDGDLPDSEFPSWPSCKNDLATLEGNALSALREAYDDRFTFRGLVDLIYYYTASMSWRERV